MYKILETQALHLPFEGHYKKYSNFTKFPGVDILWKGTVSA